MTLRHLPAIIAIGFFAELAGLVWLGSRAGVLSVLGLTALGFLVGGLLIRRSGAAIFQAMSKGRIDQKAFSNATAGSLLDGLAGVLFIIPGVITDAAAAALLLPLTRKWLADFFEIRMAGGFPDRPSGPVIEAEATEIPEPPKTISKPPEET
jgi:UPF0716 protein FxsA